MCTHPRLRLDEENEVANTVLKTLAKRIISSGLEKVTPRSAHLLEEGMLQFEQEVIEQPATEQIHTESWLTKLWRRSRWRSRASKIYVCIFLHLR